MASDFMALPDHAIDQRVLGERILADDKKCRRHLLLLENVEDLRSPARVRSIVERQSNFPQTVARSSDCERPWDAHKINVGEKPVAFERQPPLACGRERRDA